MWGLTTVTSVCSACAGDAATRRWPEARASGGEQREAHPALKGRRGSHRSEITEARLAGAAPEQLRAIAQPFARIERSHANELQAVRGTETRALRERAPNVVALLLQQARHAQILGAGVAVQFGAGDVAFFDAQNI